MIIRYESTIDEAVDSYMRLWELSRTAGRWKLQGLVAVPFLFFLLNWFLYHSFLERALFTVLGCAVFTPLYLYSYRRTLLKRTRNMLTESLGTDKPVPCEYEFTSEGVVFRRQGTEVKFLWNSVQTVDIMDRGIEILVKNNGGIAVLPRRIFAVGEMQEWYDFALSAIRSQNGED